MFGNNDTTSPTNASGAIGHTKSAQAKTLVKRAPASKFNFIMTGPGGGPGGPPVMLGGLSRPEVSRHTEVNI